MKILINAVIGKKKAGGGFQISINFIKASLARKDIEWYYFVSEDINILIGNLFSELLGSQYFVFPTQPDFKKTYWKVRNEISTIEQNIQPDIIYSILSPSYFRFRAPEVMRFANAWITNPNQYAKKTLSISKKLHNFMYSINQKRLMKKRLYFITQSNTVKEGIIKITKTNEGNVKVIPNVLPAYFSEKNTIVDKKNISNNIFIACVAAPNPHKNIGIIPDVLYILREKYKINNVVFLVTIPEKDPLLDKLNSQLKLYDLENGIKNLGYCTQSELVNLYTTCEICFLPTLLETFSATILEAMFFNLAIVASDFGFNKEVAGDSAIYFKPTNAESAAEKISLLINNPDLINDLKSKIPKYLEKYIDYNNHLEQTISFLKQCVEKHNN